ncbi:hypothetical protein [Massilia sp. TS11]|uniref:hypothetical protein n=1 Tax=Massilia sp. TS11 TaxID=2908003 RepID=UPI001ED9DFCA|nr:hypothetical protein [Massilia sp. TS11]MCG2584355.1 hypothetical protein [Massilia sp. TS11]
MLKHASLIALLSFVLPVWADPIPTTKQECTRRCLSVDPANPKKAKSDERLKNIRDRLSKESDPDKLKLIQKEEQDELEMHKEEHEKMCKFMCRNNPNE